MSTTTQLSERTRLLDREVARINLWLSAFEAANRPHAGLSRTGETLWVRHFPLPDGFGIDDIHVAMIVKDYPVEPPKGLYLLSDAHTARVVARLRNAFNVFQDRAFHGAPAMTGFEWVCVGYLEGWRYNIAQPQRGDNIEKMLLEFWRLLENQA